MQRTKFYRGVFDCPDNDEDRAVVDHYVEEIGGDLPRSFSQVWAAIVDVIGMTSEEGDHEDEPE